MGLAEDLDYLTDKYLEPGGYEPFAHDWLQIKLKTGRMAPFAFNAAQEYLHEIVELQLKHQRKVRVLNLKGRQQGCSTYWEGRFFYASEFVDGNQTFILTHQQDATDNLFEMCKRFHDNLPPEWQHGVEKSSAKEFYFAGMESGVKVGTAGTKGVGRSATIHKFHGSEVAFWPFAATHAAGVLQAVPNEDGTEIALESTANGFGNFFQVKWSAAWTVLQNQYGGDLRKMAREYDGYLPIFIPWFWQNEYRAVPEPGFTLTEEEQTLVAKYELDEEQLAWRRLKITELDDGEISGEDQFKQEYPCTPHEAFLHTGRPYFPGEVLERVSEHVLPPRWTGVLELTDAGGVEFKAQSNGYLQVWEMPVAGEHYCIGGDVSESLPHGDLNSGHVLKRGLVAEQVARVSPQCREDEYGKILVRLAKWYGGQVPLGIERNSIGKAAVIAAVDTGYKHIYMAQRATDAEKKGDKKTDKYGWETNSNTRPIMLSDLNAGLRDGTVLIRSPETLQQCYTFIRGKSGKPEAEENCFDDDVMGLAIANQMVRRTEPIKPPESHAVPEPPSGQHGWMGA